MNRRRTVMSSSPQNYSVQINTPHRLCCFLFTRASTAPAVNALDRPVRVLALVLGDAANALGAKVGVLALYAAQTAEALVAGAFPFGNEQAICDALLEAPLVQIATDGPALIVKIVNVPGALVMNLEDGPGGLVYALALMRCVFNYNQNRGKKESESVVDVCADTFA